MRIRDTETREVFHAKEIKELPSVLKDYVIKKPFGWKSGGIRIDGNWAFVYFNNSHRSQMYIDIFNSTEPRRFYVVAGFNFVPGLTFQRLDENGNAIQEIARALARRKTAKKSRRLSSLGGNREAYEYATILLKDPCSYCGQKFTEDYMSVDHIIPISTGGSNESNNLTAACRRCNSSKNNRSLLYFLCIS